MFAHLVEIVGLRWSCGDLQLFDLLGSDVNDLIDVLQCPFDQQEPCIRYQGTISLVQLRVDDRVRDAGFIFNRKEDEAVGRAVSLSGDHAAGDPSFDSVAEHTEVVGASRHSDFSPSGWTRGETRRNSQEHLT